MTGDADFSLEALFGPDGDPDRRERLAALLSDGLADEQRVQPPDIAEIAAYLDQGLSESEEQAVQQNLSQSAVARADMESAADLLEIVQNSTERPSGAVMHQAANVMMAAAAQLRHEHGYRTVAAAGERSGPNALSRRTNLVWPTFFFSAMSAATVSASPSCMRPTKLMTTSFCEPTLLAICFPVGRDIRS